MNARTWRPVHSALALAFALLCPAAAAQALDDEAGPGDHTDTQACDASAPTKRPSAASNAMPAFSSTAR